MTQVVVAQDDAAASKPTSHPAPAEDEVFTNMETLPDWRARRLFKFMYVGVWLSIVALIVAAAMKWSQRFEFAGDAARYTRANLTLALICMVSTNLGFFTFAGRCGWFLWTGKSWSRRRKVFTGVHLAILLSHSINTAFYVMTNLLKLLNYYGRIIEVMGMIRFTMWNNIFMLFLLQSRMLNLWLDQEGKLVGGKDSILADAPLKKHLFVGYFWLAYQCCPLVVFIYGIWTNDEWIRFTESGTCSPTTRVVILGGCFSIAVVIYQVTSLCLLYNGYSQLKRRPYNQFRLTNVWLRFHFLQNAVVGDFISISFFSFFWARRESCSGLTLTWHGLLPAQLAMTVLAIVNCFLWMPVVSKRHESLSLESSRLVWLENEAYGDAEQVEGDLRRHVTERKLPLFCFEMAVKLWFWSLGIYGYNSDTQDFVDPEYPPLCLEAAQNLFDLEEYDMLHVSDVNVIIAWNRRTILVAFRGTFNMKNLWTDLQFRRKVHPPKRGMYLMRTQPLVHQGFLETWQSLKHGIVDRIRAIMDAPDFHHEHARVLLTGHSLGGALAVLASYDIAKEFNLHRSKISCYTFGAPRVGNHAFVKDYNATVPDTWQVVNDRDVVPRMPKFWILFKHVGERVIMNPAGDLIVSPFFVELTLYNPPTLYQKTTSVRQHLLLSYRKSFVAVAKGQFIATKSLTGGADAMQCLMEQGCRPLHSALDVRAESLRSSTNWT